MKALLILYIIGQGSHGGIPTVKEISVSDIETCHVAGNLISNDLAYKVKEVSYRCFKSSRDYGGAYLTGVPE